jgi:hypothetical protein
MRRVWDPLLQIEQSFHELPAWPEFFGDGSCKPSQNKSATARKLFPGDEAVLGENFRRS